MRPACFGLLLVFSLAAACSDDPQGSAAPVDASGGRSGSTGSASGGPSGSAYRAGCRASVRCVTATGGSDVDTVPGVDPASCASAGGTLLRGEGCWPGEGSGCCRTRAGNAAVTTCVYDGDPNDPASSQASCVAAGGVWDTEDRSGVNRDTPQTPAEFVTGCDFAERSDPGKTGRYCVLYPASHIGSSCKEPLGVAVTTCTAEGRLGCCRKKGPILGCSYEAEGVTLESAQAECVAENGVWWAGLAP